MLLGLAWISVALALLVPRSIRISLSEDSSYLLLSWDTFTVSLPTLTFQGDNLASDSPSAGFTHVPACGPTSGVFPAGAMGALGILCFSQGCHRDGHIEGPA